MNYDDLAAMMKPVVTTGTSRQKMEILLGGFFDATGESPPYIALKKRLSFRYPGIEPKFLPSSQNFVPF